MLDLPRISLALDGVLATTERELKESPRYEAYSALEHIAVLRAYRNNVANLLTLWDTEDRMGRDPRQTNPP